MIRLALHKLLNIGEAGLMVFKGISVNRETHFHVACVRLHGLHGLSHLVDAL